MCTKTLLYHRQFCTDTSETMFEDEMYASDESSPPEEDSPPVEEAEDIKPEPQFTRFTIADILREPFIRRTSVSPLRTSPPLNESSRDSTLSCSDDDEEELLDHNQTTPVYLMNSPTTNKDTEEQTENPRFSWLQCTRYRPPKLPSECKIFSLHASNIYIAFFLEVKVIRHLT